jgi:hypothetical protein
MQAVLVSEARPNEKLGPVLHRAHLEPSSTMRKTGGLFMEFYSASAGGGLEPRSFKDLFSLEDEQ